MPASRYALCLMALLAVPVAVAQDYAGQASDALSSAGSSAGTAAVNSAIDAQTKGKGGANFKGTGFSEKYVRKNCAGLSRDRRSLGDGHRRVVRWTRICQQAGIGR